MICIMLDDNKQCDISLQRRQCTTLAAHSSYLNQATLNVSLSADLVRCCHGNSDFQGVVGVRVIPTWLAGIIILGHVHSL